MIRQLALGVSLLLAVVVQGGRVSPERARQRSVDWARRAFPARKVLPQAMRTFTDEKKRWSFHVMPIKDGGYVVTQADDPSAPVAAFSLKGAFPEDPGHPLRQILAADAAALAKYGAGVEASQSGSSARLMSDAYPTTFFEVLVKPILKTEWAQLTHNNMRQLGFGGTGVLCYNYYTPNWETNVRQTAHGLADVGDEEVVSSHYPCGCVATAGAQVMKHFAHPTRLPALNRSGDGDGADVEPYPHETYLWNRMPDRPKEGIDKLGCQAIGRICRDIGIACSAEYGPSTSMTGFALAQAFTQVFSYGAARYVTLNGDVDERKNVLMPNLVFGKPVILSIRKRTLSDDGQDVEAGHCVVADGLGCGFDSGTEKIYYHVNFGWANQIDGEATDTWYAPPRLRDYNSISSAIVNIDKTQEKGHVAGRVKSRQGGTSVKGAQVRIRRAGTLVGTAQTDDNGLFSFAVDSGRYDIEVTDPVGGSAEGAVTVSASTALNVYTEYYLDLPIAAMPEITVAWDEAGTAWVTMSCQTPNAKIYYSVNGAKPDTRANLYEARLPICGVGQVSVTAVAYADGYAVSAPITRLITFVPSANNDNLAEARVLTGTSGAVEMSNRLATRESGEPVHSPVGKEGGASVWATFTAPETGYYVFRASGRSEEEDRLLDTQLAVYTGLSMNTLSRVAANDDVNAADYNISSRVSFHATAGTTYRVAVDTRFGLQGIVTLTWAPGRSEVAEPEVSEVLAGPSETTFDVLVHSTAEWSVISCSPWVELKTSSGADGDRVRFVVSALQAGEQARSGIVMLRAGDDGEAASIVVSQASVEWVRSRAAALAAAVNTGKRILLVCGRDTCGNTSHLRNSVCEDSEIKPLLASGFVLWYCNCDNDYDDYRYYAAGLGGYTLPLVCVINPETPEEYVVRSTGFMDKAAFLAFLTQAAEGLEPSRPYGLQTTLEAGKVSLVWNAGRRASIYEVWCGDELVETTMAGTFVDSGVPSGSLSTYRVRAVNAVGKSAFSDPIRVGWNEAADEASRQFGQALGAPHVVWQTGGAFPWAPQSDVTTDGTAVQSGPSVAGESVTSELSVDVNGPCYMSFRYQTRMYASVFRVLLDGDRLFEDAAGSFDWTRQEVRIPFGKHKVTFFYQKGGYYTSGFNGVYLDDVVFADESQVPPPVEPDEDEPARPGVWTRNFDDAKAAGVTNGNLIVVVLANYESCSYSKAFRSVAWEADFQDWARTNGVYLVDADISKNDAAYLGFWSLWEASSASFPALATALAWDPATAVDNAVARNGNRMGTVTYDGTAESLKAYLSSLIQSRPTNREVTLTFYDYGNTYQREAVSAMFGQSFGSLLKEKSKKGFVFDGWWTDSSGGMKVTPDSIVPFTDTTYYARYHNVYTVDFDANGGDGATMDALSMVGGTAVKIPACTYVREGFAFDGWAVRANGATIYADGASIVDLTSTGNGRVTLYAVWRPVAADGGWVTVTSPVKVPYSWLNRYALMKRTDAETVAQAKTGKRDAAGREMAVWEDYVAGTDPTDRNDVFRITDVKMENGALKISWSPDLNEGGTKSERRYILKGRRSLFGAEEWVDMETVPMDRKADYKFFRVSVEMNR